MTVGRHNRESQYYVSRESALEAVRYVEYFAAFSVMDTLHYSGQLRPSIEDTVLYIGTCDLEYV